MVPLEKRLGATHRGLIRGIPRYNVHLTGGERAMEPWRFRLAMRLHMPIPLEGIVEISHTSREVFTRNIVDHVGRDLVAICRCRIVPL